MPSAHCSLTLSTAHCSLYTVHCSLLNIQYFLPPDHWPLSIGLCLLSTVIHCPLFSAHRPFPTVHCLLYTHCLLPTDHYPLITTHWSLPTVHYPLSTTHCLLPHCLLPTAAAYCPLTPLSTPRCPLCILYFRSILASISFEHGDCLSKIIPISTQLAQILWVQLGRIGQ